MHQWRDHDELSDLAGLAKTHYSKAVVAVRRGIQAWRCWFGSNGSG